MEDYQEEAVFLNLTDQAIEMKEAENDSNKNLRCGCFGVVSWLLLVFTFIK